MTTESIVRAYEAAARADTKATADDVVRWYHTHPERAGVARWNDLLEAQR